MMIILSPAKTFSKTKIISNQVPYFQNEAFSLIKSLKNKKISELMEGMKISEKLANEVQSYIINFGQEKLSAIHTYDGQAFKGLDISYSSDHLVKKMNERLYILSGLYGVLKPLDAISYYRLDIKDHVIKNLYPYWKKRIESFLNKYHKDEMIINLASSEYSRLLPKQIHMLTIDFLQIQDGKYKSISMFVKKMRGMMARYLIENDIEDIDIIKTIVLDGYQYDRIKSSLDILIFSKEV
jgi:uncharacterized protein